MWLFILVNWLSSASETGIGWGYVAPETKSLSSIKAAEGFCFGDMCEVWITNLSV
jgi:hypothetical protein